MTYALYKGEECLYIGTISEIAKELGVKENTVKEYLMSSYIERTSEDRARRLVPLDEEVS